MQAEHEAGVTAIGLAPDGLTIAIGTENGIIGCLDVPTHQYRTLLRSHTDTINAVAVDTHRCCLPCSPLCTACNLMQSVANVCCLHGQACQRPLCLAVQVCQASVQGVKPSAKQQMYC